LALHSAAFCGGRAPGFLNLRRQWRESSSSYSRVRASEIRLFSVYYDHSFNRIISIRSSLCSVTLSWWGLAVLDWGASLQARRSRIRISMSLDFFNSFNPSSHTMALLSTQLLTKMSTRSYWGKVRLAREADNLAAICELTVWTIWDLDISQPHGPPRPVTGMVLLLHLFLHWVCASNLS
jgi:hypothetical protein